jgi:hypothetical protein
MEFLATLSRVWISSVLYFIENIAVPIARPLCYDPRVSQICDFLCCIARWNVITGDSIVFTRNTALSCWHAVLQIPYAIWSQIARLWVYSAPVRSWIRNAALWVVHVVVIFLDTMCLVRCFFDWHWVIKKKTRRSVESEVAVIPENGTNGPSGDTGEYVARKQQTHEEVVLDAIRQQGGTEEQPLAADPVPPLLNRSDESRGRTPAKTFANLAGPLVPKQGLTAPLNQTLARVEKPVGRNNGEPIVSMAKLVAKPVVVQVPPSTTSMATVVLPPSVSELGNLAPSSALRSPENGQNKNASKKRPRRELSETQLLLAPCALSAYNGAVKFCGHELAVLAARSKYEEEVLKLTAELEKEETPKRRKPQEAQPRCSPLSN